MNNKRSSMGLRDAESRPEPRYLAIGRVLRPHGVHGELRIEMITEYPERWISLKTVYVGTRYQKYKVQSTRLHKDIVLLVLDDVADRDTAEQLRNQLIHVALEDAVPLEEGEHYYHQIVGLDVLTDQGQDLGEVVDVLTAPGANDVLVIHGVYGEVLVPVIEEAILEIDMEKAVIHIHAMPGLLDSK